MAWFQILLREKDGEKTNCIWRFECLDHLCINDKYVSEFTEFRNEWTGPEIKQHMYNLHGHKRTNMKSCRYQTHAHINVHVHTGSRFGFGEQRWWTRPSGCCDWQTDWGPTFWRRLQEQSPVCHLPQPSTNPTNKSSKTSYQ